MGRQQRLMGGKQRLMGGQQWVTKGHQPRLGPPPCTQVHLASSPHLQELAVAHLWVGVT